MSRLPITAFSVAASLTLLLALMLVLSTLHGIQTTRTTVDFPPGTPTFWGYLPLVQRAPVPPTPTNTPARAFACLPPDPGPFIREDILQGCILTPNPPPNTDETIYARLINRDDRVVPGIPMESTWFFQAGMRTCNATAGSDGIASCTLNIGQATIGSPVGVSIRVTYNGTTIILQTLYFTPR